MVKCERCGSSFSAIRATEFQNCPRCFLRDGLAVPLIAASPFEQPAQDSRRARDAVFEPDPLIKCEGMGI
jgi:predicted  nucleic acid-binding Zn-ribbon protein